MRGLLVGQAFEIASDESRPVGRGDAIELFVNHCASLGSLRFVLGRFQIDRGNQPVLDLVSLCRTVPGTQGNPQRDTVQPAAESIPVPDRSGSAHKDEEYRLKRVVNIVRVVEDATADIKYHCSVASHQFLESRLGLGMTRLEPIQDFAVRSISQAPDAEKCSDRPDGDLGSS